MADTRLPVRVPLVTEPWGILRSLRAARRNVLSIIPDIATKQPMVSGKTGKRWHMVMDPDAIRRVVLERLEDYPKSDVTKNLLRPAIGNSLFVAEGAHWRLQRRAAAPVFSHRNVTNLAPIMTRAAEASSARIADEGPGRAVNFLDEMAFADTTDGRIATHLPHRFDAVCDEQGLRTCSGRGERGLGTGMAAADHDDIESSGVLHFCHDSVV